MRSRGWWIPVCMVLAVAACGGPASDDSAEAPAAAPAGGPASADPAALALADSIVAAAGGWDAWNQARYVEFTFVISVRGEERRRTSHCWDRFTGDYRVDGTSRDGKPFVAVWNLQSGGGRTWLDGLELAGQEAHDQLERAEAICVNDCYWFLMPFKLHDPGVHLTDEGTRSDSLGNAWRVLSLRFGEDVGLTPGDRYWVYADPATGLVGRWDYILEGYEPGRPASQFSWIDWQAVGPIRLATRKLSADGAVEVRFENLVAQTSPKPEAFSYEAGS